MQVVHFGPAGMHRVQIVTVFAARAGCSDTVAHASRAACHSDVTETPSHGIS